ncbi:hypothetical protein BFJ72_g15020 [Fusarium proliferatum]|uniref:HNH nuclease domain-containing protein n=1 Tax=Gibberella intermedia TaxID=948311 RepID=A0A420RU72_GIBIN|nr:hypothetical protein BFJ72_g15020 [Fusarium proliferatum]
MKTEKVIADNGVSTSIQQCLKPRRRLFAATRQQKNVFFYHPGYQDGHNLLLNLPALNAAGIHHETARIACAIVAACNFDGYFSTSKNGPKIPDGPDDILQDKKYYFCIEDDIEYPIVPSFDNFQCPHELPESWLDDLALIELGVYRDARQRDSGYRIIGSFLPTELAHIIPQAQSDWWQKNLMYTYVTNADESFDAKCPDNTILLRCDMHKMWDDDRFAVLPKAGGWYTHVLLNSTTTEVEQEYHNVQLQPLRGVSRYFFFCRFALAIFAKGAFLRQRIRRNLAILDHSGSSKVREMSVDEYKELTNLAARGTSRSTSPTKRQRRDQSQSSPQSEAFSHVDDTPEDDADQEFTRGRSRKRAGSPILPDDVDMDGTFAPSSPPPKRQRLTDTPVQPHTPPQSISPNRS